MNVFVFVTKSNGRWEALALLKRSLTDPGKTYEFSLPTRPDASGSKAESDGIYLFTDTLRLLIPFNQSVTYYCSSDEVISISNGNSGVIDKIESTSKQWKFDLMPNLYREKALAGMNLNYTE